MMSIVWFFHLLPFIFVALNVCNCQILEETAPECRNITVSEVDLGKTIFRAFSGTWQRPRRNARHSVVVNLTLVLSSINDVVEKHRLVKVTAHLALRWYDEFHVWNETYPLYCIPYIGVDQLWRPDVAQMNSQSKYALMEMPGEKIRLYSDGFTSYSPGGTFDAFCDFDFTLFPFDSQKCSILLESWRYTHEFVQFTIGDPGSGVTTHRYNENDQWQLIGTEQSLLDEIYTYNELQFDRVEFTIFIRRKSGYYILNVIVPSVIISLAQMSTFSLSAMETVKLELSFTCLLAHSVFQLQVVDDMPRSSDRTPLISIYIDLQMFYIALSMLIQGSAFVLLSKADLNYRLDDSDEEAVPPNWLYRVTIFIGQVLRVKGPPLEPKLASQKRSAKPIKPVKNTSSTPPSIKVTFADADVLIDAESNKTTLDTADSLSNGTNMNVLQIEESNGHLLRRRHSIKKAVLLNSSRRWIYMAAVVDRLTFSLYLACITLTPLIIFIRAAYY